MKVSGRVLSAWGLPSLAALALGACSPSPYTLQKRFAERRLRPVPWAEHESAPVPTRTLRARVYADSEHRAVLRGWQVRFYRIVKRANPVLRDALNVELEVVQAKDWPREQTVGGLRPALADLAAHDPGDDVDLVIGMIGPLDRIGRVHTELGMARLFGKHLVMRPGADLALYDYLARQLHLLSQEEREALYADMREHREAAVLLHELGHLFGGLHVDDDADLMAKQLDSRQNRFHPANLELMRIMAGPGSLTARLIAYRKALATQQPAPVFEFDDRARMLVLLDAGRGRLSSADTMDLYPPVGADEDPDRPVTDDVIVERAERIASQSPDAAWILLAPVLERHPTDARYHEVACRIALGRASQSGETLQRCARAVQLAPAEVAPRILAGVYLSAARVQ